MFAKGTGDKVFIFLTAILVFGGLLVFASASLGILAKNRDIFYSIVSSQLLFGLAGGLFAFIAASRIPYRLWKKYSFWIFAAALAITALVLIPGIGFEHGGARRWLHIGSISFQPSELLKFGLVVYMAAWFSYVKDRVGTLRWGLGPFLAMVGLSATIMLSQPDTGTFLVMLSATCAIYFAAGAPLRHMLYLGLIGILGFSMLIIAKPYLMDRLTTFVNPSTDPLGNSYQIKQSLIAIGSGELFGRGLGQSVQKFNYLPEPVGDSVFAIIGEELGFIGATATVILFLVYAFRGFRIAHRAPEQFGSYLVIGLITLVVGQAFLNIAALIGIFPLTGVPLTFMSHGGTALLFALGEVGIILNVSRTMRRT